MNRNSCNGATGSRKVRKGIERKSKTALTLIIRIPQKVRRYTGVGILRVNNRISRWYEAKMQDSTLIYRRERNKEFKKGVGYEGFSDRFSENF